MLGADAHGDFTATYNGGTAVMPALIDSGTDAYAFNDPTIAVCSTGAFVGYYCPAVAPQSVFAVNTGVGTNNASSTVDFAIADPNTFVANAAAFIDLGGGGGSTSFTWGMPFFYGRKIYIGIDQRVAGTYTGPTTLTELRAAGRPSALAGQFLGNRREAAAGGNIARRNAGAIAQRLVGARREQHAADVG